jgi:uncharacterized protein (DUF4415 family)
MTKKAAPVNKKAPEKKKAVREKSDRILVDLELDSDVVDWLRSFGKDYEDKFNAVLRAEMMKEVERAKPTKRRQSLTTRRTPQP